MNQRTKWMLSGIYVFALILPLIVVAFFSTHEIVTWLSTGMCPAGPMDRPSRLCGAAEFFVIVLLGGWAAFLSVPILIGWWILCTGGFIATLMYLRKRDGFGGCPD